MGTEASTREATRIERDRARGELRGAAWPEVPGRSHSFFGGKRLRGREGAEGITEAAGPAASLLRDGIFRRTLALSDLMTVLGTLLAITALSHRGMDLTWLAFVVAPTLLVVMKLMGLYDRDEALLHKTTLEEVPQLFQVATFVALLSWLTGELFVSHGLDRRDALFVWAVATVALVLGRILARALALRMTTPERCLFIGDPVTGEMIADRLSRQHGGVKATLIARLDASQASSWSSRNFSPTRMAQIRRLVLEQDIQRAIIAPQGADGRAMLDFVRTFKAVGVRVSVVPELLEVVGSAVAFDELHGLTIMGVRSFDLSRSSRAVKRAFDLCAALLGLILLSPVMAVIALAIKLDSRGPVFFRQARVGRRGRRFQLRKFRTMVENAEALKDRLRERNETHGLFKIADDPRITRVGKWLRRSSLDELPQLFNVLLGQMSLVGPRPLVAEEDERIEGWQRRRLALTPGMTGQWQILGPRVPLNEMVAIDYLYVANWSLWSDMKILLRTVPHVCARRGL